MRTMLGALMFACALSSADAEINEQIKPIIEDKCSHCHGKNGEASSAVYPRLAGQNRTYLMKQLQNFRDGLRLSDTMIEMAAGLKDDEIAALAEHFSSQKTLSHRIRSSKKTLAAVGSYIYHEGNSYSDIPPCAACHGDDGKGNEKLPRLAGQHRRYIVAQLEAFHERKRTNDNSVMHSIAKKLTEMELNAVALYVSGMNAEK